MRKAKRKSDLLIGGVGAFIGFRKYHDERNRIIAYVLEDQGVIHLPRLVQGSRELAVLMGLEAPRAGKE